MPGVPLASAGRRPRCARSVLRVLLPRPPSRHQSSPRSARRAFAMTPRAAACSRSSSPTSCSCRRRLSLATALLIGAVSLFRRRPRFARARGDRRARRGQRAFGSCSIRCSTSPARRFGGRDRGSADGGDLPRQFTRCSRSWAIPGAFAGVLWGILGGALPGISPSIAMALLLPLTYGMDPVTAIVLLASVYVGAEYGGSIPAILIRTPGTNSASATVIDGYEMARQGRAGEALGISLIAGFVGGLFGLVVLVVADQAARDGGAGVHAAGLFRARHARPLRRRGPVRRLVADQGPAGGRDRPDARHRRPRSDVGRAALHVRRARSPGRHQAAAGDDRPLRRHRNAGADRRAAVGEGRRGRRARSSCPNWRDDEAAVQADGHRLGDRDLRRRDARRRRHHRGVHGLHRSEALVEGAGGIRQGLARRRGRARSAPTTSVTATALVPLLEPRHSRLQLRRRAARRIPGARPAARTDAVRERRRKSSTDSTAAC